MVDEREVDEVLRARFATLARRHGVPGAQLAIHHNGRTTTVEFGELTHHGGRVSAGSAFPIGSITKTFTAALAMVLVADGDLELDTPVKEYLPDVGELGDEITLRQLLSHTAGFDSGPDSTDIRMASPRRYLAEYCRSANLVRPPGTGFSYSNTGYVVVGAIVAAVCGMPWAEALESIVLGPLGITPSFVDRNSSARPVASGHAVQAAAGRARAVRQDLAPVLAPAGALAVSAADLVRLGRALRDGADLLPAGHAESMRRPEPQADPFGLADGWGLGLAIFQADFQAGGPTTWVGHDGNGYGTACYLRIDPVGGSVVAFTGNANTAAGLWPELCDQLRLFGVPIGPRPSPVAGLEPAAVPLGCAGVYVNGDVEFAVTVHHGRAMLAVDDERPVPMTFHSGLVFAVPDPVSHRPVLGGRFTRHPTSGQITGLQIGGRLASRHSGIRPSRSSLIA